MKTKNIIYLGIGIILVSLTIFLLYNFNTETEQQFGICSTNGKIGIFENNKCITGYWLCSDMPGFSTKEYEQAKDGYKITHPDKCYWKRN